MSRLDDRLTRELERAARPADPSGIFDRIDRRRGRRHAVRRAASAALAVVVIAGSVGGFVFLSDAFGPARTPGGETPVQHANGLLVVSAPDALGLGDLYSVEPSVDPASRDQRQLTMSSASDGGASVSPDGRTVAFVRTDDTGSAIFTIGIDGTELRQIADAAIDPTWSPDGSRIAFVRGARGQDGIWTMTPDGGDAKLIAGTDALVTGNPAWSPDGTSIAFEGAGLDDQAVHICDIYMIPVDATGPQDLHRLTDTPDLNETSPSWAPDGARIVFSQSSTHPNIDKTGGIAVMEADGSDVVFLTSGGPYDNNPSWSPDGSLIAFDRSILTHPPMIFTIRPDGTDVTQITGASEPAWQPIPLDGSESPSATSPDVLGIDIGLDFRVCRANRLDGIDMLGDGAAGSAWTGVRIKPDGSCPSEFEGFNVVAVDHTGDGLADSWWGPMPYCIGCRPFDSTDLDADGAEELVVLAQWGTTPQYLLFTLTATPESFPMGFEPGVQPILIADPGHPQGGFPPGVQVALWAGGDEGFAGSVRCEGYPATPIIIATWSDHPVEGPGSETLEVHETRLRLGAHGLMHVVDSSDGTQPTSDPAPETWTGLACGVRFWPAF